MIIQSNVRYQSLSFIPGVAVAITTAMNWGSTYVFTQSFPSILASIKASGSLYMICVLDLAASLFYLFLLPETKVL